MSANRWIQIATIAGELQAEILRGLLEAQGIPVVLSQEGAGRAIGLSVGPLGEVAFLVPEDLVERAEQVLDDYQTGAFESDTDLEYPEEMGDEEGEDQNI